MKFLGGIICKDSFRAGITKLPSIKLLKWPNMKRKLKSLIETINWLSRFIPDLRNKVLRIHRSSKRKKRI